MNKPISEAEMRAMSTKEQLAYVNGLSDDELRAMGGRPVLANALGGVLFFLLIGLGIFFAFNPVLAVLLLLVITVLSALSGGFFFFTF